MPVLRAHHLALTLDTGECRAVCVFRADESTRSTIAGIGRKSTSHGKRELGHVVRPEVHLLVGQYFVSSKLELVASVPASTTNDGAPASSGMLSSKPTVSFSVQAIAPSTLATRIGTTRIGLWG